MKSSYSAYPEHSSISLLNARLQLCKLHLSFFVGFSSCFGSCLASGNVDTVSLGVGLTIFFLSCGCSVLNNIQDRKVDATFVRTMYRSLPKNILTVKQAYTQCIFLLLFSFLALLFCFSVSAAVLGLLAIILYNGCYTPLKKTTMLAIIPGLCSGFLPVIIGWGVSGGGMGREIVIISLLFAAWQIPHTWLVVLVHRSDYSGSSIPTLIDFIGEGALKRIIFLWLVTIAVLMIAVTVTPLVLSDFTGWFIVANAFALVLCESFFLLRGGVINYRYTFIGLNISLLLFMLVLVLERA